jgi:RNA polymerase sigma-70 factor (ECF subfamily)
MDQVIEAFVRERAHHRCEYCRMAQEDDDLPFRPDTTKGRPPTPMRDGLMSEQDTFVEFIRRIRAGDEQAAAEMVRRYEPLIRREIRLQLEDRRLARLFDSMDICQSVLKSFFCRTATGQYDLDTPEQLQRLLVTMARNKLASAARSQHRQRRDQRRVSAGEEKLKGIAADDPTPSAVVASKELLERIRQAFNEEERQLADLRGEGLAWGAIADRLGGTAQARRMQLARAVERVARELGLDDDF